MRIRVIDLETTGFAPPSGIVEIGSQDVIVERIDEHKYSVEMDKDSMKQTYVHPGVECSAEVMAVHHLTEEDWRDAPPLEEAAKLFDGADLYCAHNAKFEQQWLKYEVPWICTYKSALKIYPKAPKHTNQVLRYHLGLCMTRPERDLFPHRAWPDAYVTAFILMEMLKEHPVEQLVAWTGQAILLEKVTFGKYKDQYWADVPSDYMKYMLSGNNVRQDVADTCKHHLKMRRVPGFFYG